MRVGAHNRLHTSGKLIGKGNLLAGCFRMQINQINIRINIIQDILHAEERRIHNVIHPDLTAKIGDGNAHAVDLYNNGMLPIFQRLHIGWANHAVCLLNKLINIIFREGMISHGAYINAHGKQLMINLSGNALTMCRIFSIGNDQIDFILLLQPRQLLPHTLSSNGADNISKKQNIHATSPVRRLWFHE